MMIMIDDVTMMIFQVTLVKCVCTRSFAFSGINGRMERNN